MRCLTRWLGIGVALGLSACAHTIPVDAPVVDRVLVDQALREQLVARGTQDEHFVHEVLHQLGQGPDGDRKLARLLAEHLRHHPTLERAMFQELATHREFQEWLIERLRTQTQEP
ncbi:MAG TPA: hypothetical protein PKN47_09625 [Nitrospira sp.]|uniref:hypothetical protein n=1 Tax=Nitrospira sp. ND1 TaxID=1658518 RepID=UPI0009BC5184|nr:hypothetical protein [Nitrospira sp. ND1]MCS6325961.1 hypothetical protein [Nitrospira sp.]SLM42222.1 exported hypothetical protein [Nitrospira sp. ND1]HNP81707.1 hypothetical protein [Nitrospira sp.]HRC43532.1 hypothetical protein [Nitrospira sp.]